MALLAGVSSDPEASSAGAGDAASVPAGAGAGPEVSAVGAAGGAVPSPVVAGDAASAGRAVVSAVGLVVREGLSAGAAAIVSLLPVHMHQRRRQLMSWAVIIYMTRALTLSAARLIPQQAATAEMTGILPHVQITSCTNCREMADWRLSSPIIMNRSICMSMPGTVLVCRLWHMPGTCARTCVLS